jgi:hypothetical protein
MAKVLARKIEHGVSRNKKTRHAIDVLISAGLSLDKALAMVAYFGTLTKIRNLKTADDVRRYKYIADLISDEEAEELIFKLKQ